MEGSVRSTSTDGGGACDLAVHSTTDCAVSSVAPLSSRPLVRDGHKVVSSTHQTNIKALRQIGVGSEGTTQSCAIVTNVDAVVTVTVMVPMESSFKEPSRPNKEQLSASRKAQVDVIVSISCSLTNVPDVLLVVPIGTEDNRTCPRFRSVPLAV